MSKFDEEYIHPGVILREQMERVYGMSEQEFARFCNLSPDIMHGLLHEYISVTEDIANLLCNHLHISPKFWLDAQRMYDSNFKKK